jgi:hypothetical protein
MGENSKRRNNTHFRSKSRARIIEVIELTEQLEAIAGIIK